MTEDIEEYNLNNFPYEVRGHQTVYFLEENDMRHEPPEGRLLPTDYTLYQVKAGRIKERMQDIKENPLEFQ